MWDKIISGIDVAVVVLFGTFCAGIYARTKSHSQSIATMEKRLDKGDGNFDRIMSTLADIRVEVGKIGEHIRRENKE